MSHNKFRKIVYEKYGGKCAYCGCDLQKGWHIDHLEPLQRTRKIIGFKMLPKRTPIYEDTKIKENDTLENMMPSCASCNHYKSTMGIEKFRNQIEKLIYQLNERITQYKIAKRYGLVEETQKPVKFYFEQLKKNDGN